MSMRAASITGETKMIWLIIWCCFLGFLALIAWAGGSEALGMFFIIIVALLGACSVGSVALNAMQRLAG